MAKNRSLAVAGLALLVTFAAAPSATADVSGADIVKYINALRTAHGIPAGIAEDASLSDGCRKHNHYSALNKTTTHNEDPGKPGYTKEGADAALTSVLYTGKTWTATQNPFEEAPIHLHQVLSPRINRLGAAESEGYGCVTTLASQKRAAPPVPVTYTYPANGKTEWFTQQTAFESPYPPGERVGIPKGATTGPYLYALFDGPDVNPGDTSSGGTATLTEPAGPVDIAFVDNSTSGLDGYLPLGMQIIPKRPLKPNTTYTATVSGNVTTGGGFGPQRPAAHTWSFTTRGRENAVNITEASTNGRTVQVRVTSAAPGAVVTATGPGARVTQPVADGAASLTLGADGVWNVCVRSGGAGTEFLAAENCKDVAVMNGVKSDDRSGSAPPFMVSFPTKVKPGRTFKTSVVAVSRFSVSYVVKSGRKTVKTYKRKTFKAGMKTFKVKVPKRYSKKGQKVKLTIKVTTGGKTYTANQTIVFG